MSGIFDNAYGLQDGPYSFIFFSSNRDEPAHIHVKRDRQPAKFWALANQKMNHAGTGTSPNLR
jgi:hypothetical protein